MSELQNTLRSLHVALGNAGRLDSEDRALLETVLTDIQNVLQASGNADIVTGEHGDALEGAAVRLEAEHPGVAAAVRAVLDALAKAGI